MPFIDNSNAPHFDIPGVSFTSLATPSRGTKETAVWRLHVAPHNEGAVHHLTREEIIVAISGAGAVQIGDERYPLKAGDAFAIPAFTDFHIDGEGDAPFEAISIMPAGSRAVVAGRPSFQPPWSI